MNNPNIDLAEREPFNLSDLLVDYPVVFSVLLLACVPFLLLTLNDYNTAILSAWFMPDSLTKLVDPISIWRLWTPAFVHYTLPHIIPNLLLWWLFASKIEQRSRTELVVIFLIIAGCSNFAQWWFTGPKFGGLSGVAYGLMGYVWILHRFTNNKKFSFDPVIGVIMFAAIPVTASGAFGRFSNYAHISGLLCGIGLAFYSIKFGLDKNNKKTEVSNG